MERATEVLSKYGEPKKQLAYGTAGFRERHDLPLEYVFFRMGLLAVLRKCSLKGSCIGAVITASHNHEVDNGIKLVDWDGGMLSQQWEPFAVQLTNCPIADFRSQFETIVRACGIDVAQFAQTGVVLIGRDTRPHSLGFHQCMEEGVRLLGATCADLGEVTTPILHFVVRDMNFTGKNSPSLSPFSAQYWLDRYNHTMTNGYCALLRTAQSSTLPETRIIVDASFGVGSISLTAFLAYYNAQRANSSAGAMPGLVLDIRNPARAGSVNEHCGAEHAQKLQLPPAGVSAETDANQLMCSFDGDGDRIVFHAFLASAGKTKWALLDGDKIAALFAKLLQQELSTAGLTSAFTCAVVQTAYANGASTQFIRSLGMPIYMAKTGVKYLHHKAQEFDVGIYFEANGHGTVIFSERFQRAVGDYVPVSADGRDRVDLAYARLKASMQLINPAVGDALSDMLYCLAALQVLDIDLPQWHAMYTDLPSKQQKVSVPDKTAVSCSEDETTVTRPAALQADLESAMRSVRQGRCFVRPSGTEDCVRIYAEAATQAEADELTALTHAAIRKHLG